MPNADNDNSQSHGRPPARRSAIASFMVMDVMRAAAALEAAGRSIIHMEVGQPGTPAPKTALDAVRRAMTNDNLGYTLALGIDPLRERIAKHYHDVYGIEVARDRIIVTSGSSGAFILAFLTLFDAGARVALPSPGYPCYRHILTALDCTPTVIETGLETRWMPTVETLAAAHGTAPLDGLLIASPANPTGTLIEPERLEAIIRFTEREKIWFISDEIYHGLTYDWPAATALAYSDEAIVINSFSKYFSMTGWRIGWMVVPERLVRTVERLKQNLFISAPAASQQAALAAFDGADELEANRRTYADNRAIFIEALTTKGVSRIAPADGAFYIYADVSHLTDHSGELARQMLEEIGIAATPGIDFDETRGHKYLRFSYSRSTSEIREAAKRFKAWPSLGASG